MKSELETIKELRDFFHGKWESAENILLQPSVSQVNTMFFTLSRDYHAEFKARFSKLYDQLRGEKIEARVSRALGDTTKPDIYERVIQRLQKDQEKLIKAQKETEENSQKDSKCGKVLN